MRDIRTWVTKWKICIALLSECLKECHRFIGRWSIWLKKETKSVKWIDWMLSCYSLLTSPCDSVAIWVNVPTLMSTDPELSQVGQASPTIASTDLPLSVLVIWMVFPQNWDFWLLPKEPINEVLGNIWLCICLRLWGKSWFHKRVKWDQKKSKLRVLKRGTKRGPLQQFSINPHSPTPLFFDSRSPRFLR